MYSYHHTKRVDTGKKTFDYWKKIKVHPYSPHGKKNLRHWKKET